MITTHLVFFNFFHGMSSGGTPTPTPASTGGGWWVYERKRKRRRETKELLNAAFDVTLQEMFATVSSDVVSQEEAQEMVAPFVRASSPDWDAMRADMVAARDLMLLYAETVERKRLEAELDDDDEMIIMLEKRRYES